MFMSEVHHEDPMKSDGLVFDWVMLVLMPADAIPTHWAEQAGKVLSESNILIRG